MDRKLETESNMYAGAKTWNPFVGCAFDCAYCRPSFQAQAKRQKHRCLDCYEFRPHWHPERLFKIPSSEIVFVCGNGDISFCQESWVWSIIRAIERRNDRRPDQTYLFQSKRPECFQPFVEELPPNVILGTTLETNQMYGYKNVSKAPPPYQRANQLHSLDYPRKFVTVEPVLQFDRIVFADILVLLGPEFVYIGYNSRPKQVQLPEPSEEKVAELIRRLQLAGIEVRGKDLRGIELEG